MQQSQKSRRIQWELQLWGGKSFSSAPVHRAKIHIAHKPTAFITDCKNHFRGHVGNHYMKKMKIRINEYTIYRFLMGNGECNCVSFLKNFSIVKQRPVLFFFSFLSLKHLHILNLLLMSRAVKSLSRRLLRRLTQRLLEINLLRQTTDGFQRLLAAFQHHYIWLQMSHSQGEEREDPQSFYSNW